MEIGPIRYARAEDGISIAYRVLGETAPYTMVHAGGIPSHLDAMFTISIMRRFHERVSESGIRSVLYDPRGTGLSARGVSEISPDTMVADLSAVIAAMELERFVLFAGPIAAVAAIPYAHAHADRVEALILDGATAYGGEIPGLEA